MVRADWQLRSRAPSLSASFFLIGRVFFFCRLSLLAVWCRFLRVCFFQVPAQREAVLSLSCGKWWSADGTAKNISCTPRCEGLSYLSGRPRLKQTAAS